MAQIVPDGVKVYAPPSAFYRRSERAKRMGEIVYNWLVCMPGMIIENTGVEHTTTYEERRALSKRTDKEALAKRKAPDKHIVLSPADFKADEKMMFSECQEQPYTLTSVHNKAHCPVDGIEVRDLAVVEWDAWEHYLDLAKTEKMALLLYVAWRPEKLYMEWVSRDYYIMYLKGMKNTLDGSGTPMARLHLGRFRTMSQFFVQVLGVDPNSPELRQAIRNIIFEMSITFDWSGHVDPCWLSQTANTGMPDRSGLDREWMTGATYQAQKWNRELKAEYDRLKAMEDARKRK